jgi:hypothetical protein
LSLLSNSDGLDKKKRNIKFRVKMVDMVRVLTNSKDGFTEEKLFMLKKNLFKRTQQTSSFD